MKREKLYETEAALCAGFLEWVKANNGRDVYGKRSPTWTAYAETAGWDILLVAEDGTQLGIQAKMAFNMKVLHQCLPEHWSLWRDRGPDFRAVLVPEFNSSDLDICEALGLGLFGRSGRSHFAHFDGEIGRLPEFTPGLDLDAHATGWHYWNPAQRCELPEFVPDVVAGASGPVQLTKWKIAALRITARLEVFGKVTRKDFQDLQIDPRRWTGPSGWVKPGDVKGEFVRGDGLDFDRSHPSVYAQILAEVRAGAEKQQPPATAHAPVTGDLLA